MSWKDRDTLDLNITTGDGKQYTVAWLTASQKIKWHGGENAYIELNDTLIKKRKRQGRVFPLEFFFTSEDHIEEAAAFRASLDDENPVTIEHPYYNTIIAQILELEIDNKDLNYSRCTCVALETMVGESAIITDKIDIVLLKKVELDDLIQEQPAITGLSITEINSVKATTAKNHKIGATIIKVQEQAENYQNAFRETSAQLNAFTAAPLQAMVTLNTMLTMPAQFSSSVVNRIRVLKEQFDVLRGTISGLLSLGSKRMYEYQQATILTTMCKAAVLPELDDYRNAATAMRIAATIQTAFQTLQVDLDALQSENNGSPLSYVQEFNISLKMEETVLATVSGLFSVALNGRRQRSFTLTEDSNVILLTHMLYRLDPVDANMQELIANNNLKCREIPLIIPKGTSITYYI